MPTPQEERNERPPAEGEAPAPLHADRLTWAVLLGRWVDFARGAVGLPGNTEGTRMRESVPDIIMLQAVWFSLQHLHELAPPERALGIARADVLIEKHELELRQRWSKRLPEKIAELIAEAREKLAAAADGE